MAGVASPLLVRVSPADGARERLETKLEAHFQSRRRSGGGECSVRAQDRAQGVYAVYFLSEEAKNRVKAHKIHDINVDGKTLEIHILPNSEVATTDPERRWLPTSAASTFSASNTSLLQNNFERNLGGTNVSDLDTITRKIFLSVSATLNTDLFTRQERGQAMMAYPSLKADVCSSQLGIEKVSGDYDDIQKLHSHFKKLLEKSQRSSTFLQPKGQNPLEQMDVDMEDLKEEQKDDLEDRSNMQVPSAIFEYFSHVCKKDIEELEQKFNVRMTWNNRGNGLTSVRLASLGASTSIEKAQQTFVTSFQKIASVVKQERIPFTDRFHMAEVQEALGSQCKSVLVKTDVNGLILRGTAKEISAAKGLIEEIKGKGLDKNSKAHSPASAIEVDVDTYKFLEPILAKDVQAINQNYGTEIDIKSSSKNGKLLIMFKPKKYSYSDDSLKAYKSFCQAYEKVLAEPREKNLLKLSEVQKKLLNQFFAQLQRGNPRVSLRKNGDQLVIRGLPEEICKTEKHIVNFLESAEKQSLKGMEPFRASNSGAIAGVPSEQKNGHKMHLPQGKPDLKATEVKQEEPCPICMDNIHQKERLPKCKHEFCKECIKEAMKHKPACPVCNVFYGKIEGNQPPGTMHISKERFPLPGYEGSGTILISYVIHDGIQTADHPNPGRRFSGARRIAYLPDNKEGREVLSLLQQAFHQKLIFTVGQSHTTGCNDVVTWNDIHHKTSLYGGPSNFGYPDPHYLKRVREELKAKGIE